MAETKVKKINASKDECKKALTALFNMKADNADLDDDANFKIVDEFLNVAMKRLPSEKAIAADAQRKKEERKATKAAAPGRQSVARD